jgi:hypothetical protein
LSTLQDNVDGVAREVGKVLTPALIGILQQLNTSLSQTPAFVEDIALAFQYAAGQIAPFLNGLSQMQWFFTNLTPPGWAMQVIGGASERGKSTIRGAASRQRQSQKNAFIGPVAPQMQGPTVPERLRQKPNNLPPPLMVSTGGKSGSTRKGKSDAERAAEKAAKDAATEAQRVADVVRDQEFITKQKGIQTKFAQLIFEAEQAADPVRARQLQTAEALVLAGNETARLLEAETNSTAQLAIARTRQGEMEAIRQEGMLGVLQLQLEQQKNFDEIIAGLDLELALKSATTEQAREQLRLEAEIAKLRGQGVLTPKQIDIIKGKKTELAKPKTTQQLLQEEADAAKLALEKLVEPANMISNAAAGIGDAFATSFRGVIDGTMTAKEALGSFFKSVADMFLDMAAQIIAAWLKMIVLNTVLKIFGGAASSAASGGGFTASGAGFGGSNSFSTFNAGGATAFGNPAFMAEGGFVTGPTSAVIGEGGESEYVIPASKMQSAMSRYSRGARGEGVIAGSGGGSEGGSGAAAAGPMVVDVRYSVERINDVEYVTASAFQAGMRQAAQQGAAQGEQRTLRRLQQSPGTRKRVGI